jgi:7-cyano-7-deazaguanine reductase
MAHGSFAKKQRRQQAQGITQESPMKKNKKTDSSRFDGLSLLKRNENQYPDAPEEAPLETFENLYAGRNYVVTFDCPEFTSLCPVTGQPDYGAIEIRYIPNKTCIESKSLKLHLFAYRNRNTFHEEAVNAILEEIVSACNPRWIEVSGKFRPRGGIAIEVKAESGKRPA